MHFLWLVLSLATVLWVLLLIHSVLRAISQHQKEGWEWKRKIDLGRYAACESIQGRRAHMEDSYMAIAKVNGNPQVSYFGVYDGHGGRRASDFVAEHLHDYVFQRNFKADPEKALTEAFLAIDDEWMALSEPDGWNDGTTVLGALIMDGTVYVANAGDSRAVLVKGEDAVEMSVDHKPNRADERHRIESKGGIVALNGTWRVQGMLAVSRAVGDRRLKKFVTAEPEIKKIQIGEDDHFLILATDGLWDVVSNQDSVDIVRSCGDIQTAARNLVIAASHRGTMDNTTALVIDLRPYRK